MRSRAEGSHTGGGERAARGGCRARHPLDLQNIQVRRWARMYCRDENFISRYNIRGSARTPLESCPN